MSFGLNEILKWLFVYSSEQPILYTRPVFWLLFVIIIGLYSFFYKKNFLRNIYLLFISFFLYYKTNGSFVFLLVSCSVLNYLFGLSINSSTKNISRRFWLSASVITNLFLLGYFKYAYFFTDSFNKLFHTNFEVVNWLILWQNNLTESTFNVSQILLPVGISFYTFQAISYIADVYKQKINPVKNIFDFSFYLAFFPQLVAGPIVRASTFIPQLYRKYQLTKNEFGHAVYLILKGLIKKIIFADFIAINFIDRIFASPLSYSGIENILSIYGYSLQIYCDFAGYTDIAIGLALLMGFKLPVNFNEPYKATNLTNFWRRWHISLSLWLRDYLYIPLGGNRKGNTRTFLNLFITMLVGGLWHGANIKFIIWGILHGIGLIINKIWNKIFKNFYSHSKWKKFVGAFITFNLVTFAWIFFRAKDWEVIRQIIFQIGKNLNISIFPDLLKAYFLPFSLLLLGYILIWFPFKWKEKSRGWFIQSPLIIKIFISIVIIILLYQTSTSELQAFIYFRF